MNLLKTILPNQLVQNGNFESASGWTPTHCTISASNNILTLTNIDADNSTPIYANVLGTTQNHKYLVSCYVKYNNHLPSDSVWVGSGGYDGYTQSVSSLNEWSNICGIFTRNSGGDDTFRIYPRLASLSAGDTVNFKDCMCIDLTLLYGAGLEPSVSEFKKNYTLPYYPYSLTNTTGLLTCANGAITADISSMLPSGMCVGDISKMNWTYNSYHHIFIASGLIDTGADAMCMKYPYMRSITDKCLTTEWYIEENSIQIKDTDYTDVQSFKNANEGVLIFYREKSSQSIIKKLFTIPHLKSSLCESILIL